MNMYDNGTVTQQASVAESNATKAAKYDKMKEDARLNDAATMGAQVGASKAYEESSVVINELMNRFNRLARPQTSPGLAGISAG